jgi:pimeloyl-ACP methyl ester carboxylesterase
MLGKDTSTKSKTLALGDGRILSYALYGPSEGIPVLGFHGMPGSRLMMKVLEPAADTVGVRLIAPERPGYGRSQAYYQGRMLSYSRDIRVLVDALGLERFGLVGVSGGGPYALACAHELPQRLISTAVVSGIGPLSLPNSFQGMVRMNRIMFKLGRFSPSLTGLLLPHLIRSSLPSMAKLVQQGSSPLSNLSPQAFAIIAADQSEAIRTGGHGIAFDLKSLWQPWGFRLEDIRSKVYLWHGEDDNLAPVRLAHEMAGRLPNCEAEFYAGEGHTDPLTKHSEEILARIVGIESITN